MERDDDLPDFGGPPDEQEDEWGEGRWFLGEEDDMNLDEVVRRRARAEAEESARQQGEFEKSTRAAIRTTLKKGLDAYEFEALRPELVPDGVGYLLTWHGIEYRLVSEDKTFAGDGIVAVWRKDGGFLRRVFSGKDLLLWLAEV